MAATKCAACNSTRRAEIDRRLAAGESTRVVSAWLATQGERIAFGSLALHSRNHPPEQVAQAPKQVAQLAQEVAQVAQTELQEAPEPLNERQQRFVLEFLIDGIGTAAALRAGYARSGARVEAHRLLTNANIQAAIAVARAEMAERNKATADAVLQRWAARASGNLKRVARWGPKKMKLIPSSDLDADTAATIQSISEKRTEFTNKDGETTVKTVLTIKLHDPKGADDSLAKHLGMFVDRVEVDTAVTITRDDRIAEMSDDELAEFAVRLGRGKHRQDEPATDGEGTGGASGSEP